MEKSRASTFGKYMVLSLELTKIFANSFRFFGHRLANLTAFNSLGGIGWATLGVPVRWFGDFW
jgi:hypothetical protein